MLGGQYTNGWRDGIFVRYLYKWQSVGGDPIKLNGSGACLVTAHHVGGFVCSYIIYQTNNTAYQNCTSYHEIFKKNTTVEFNMYLDSANCCFYFKGNGGGIQIGIIPLCGTNFELVYQAADLSQMTKIF